MHGFTCTYRQYWQVYISPSWVCIWILCEMVIIYLCGLCGWMDTDESVWGIEIVDENVFWVFGWGIVRKWIWTRDFIVVWHSCGFPVQLARRWMLITPYRSLSICDVWNHVSSLSPKRSIVPVCCSRGGCRFCIVCYVSSGCKVNELNKDWCLHVRRRFAVDLRILDLVSTCFRFWQSSICIDEDTDLRMCCWWIFLVEKRTTRVTRHMGSGSPFLKWRGMLGICQCVRHTLVYCYA